MATTEEPQHSWTQAVCDDCAKVRNVNPVSRLNQPETERCCYCGEEKPITIYIREDPKHVPFPREKGAAEPVNDDEPEQPGATGKIDPTPEAPVGEGEGDAA